MSTLTCESVTTRTATSEESAEPMKGTPYQGVTIITVSDGKGGFLVNRELNDEEKRTGKIIPDQIMRETAEALKK